MEKGEPKNLVADLLDIIHPHSTAPPSLPPFLISFPFYTCYSKPDETIVSKLIFFPFQISTVNKHFKGRENLHANF